MLYRIIVIAFVKYYHYMERCTSSKSVKNSTVIDASKEVEELIIVIHQYRV